MTHRNRENHHHPQQLARHPVRSLDQPVSRLRARLHLLLRAAKPRLSGHFAGAGFRDPDDRQAQCRRAAARRAVRARLQVPIALGTNTDPYQPIERELSLTRSLPRSAAAYTIRSASSPKTRLIPRDPDCWRAFAEAELVAVHVSVTTLDDELKRRMEPRTAGPKAAAPQ